MEAIPTRNTFDTGERLKSRKTIDELFRRKSFVSTPGFRLYYMEQEQGATTFPAQYAFAVSKKHFPHAPDRNRIKRLMREAVRLQKNTWEWPEKGPYAFLFLYTGQDIPDFGKVKEAAGRLFGKEMQRRG